jgi:hypothetical protein
MILVQQQSFRFELSCQKKVDKKLDDDAYNHVVVLRLTKSTPWFALRRSK